MRRAARIDTNHNDIAAVRPYAVRCIVDMLPVKEISNES